MRRLLYAIPAAMLVMPAMAADYGDYSVPVASSWSGFYIGVHAGYGTGRVGTPVLGAAAPVTPVEENNGEEAASSLAQEAFPLEEIEDITPPAVGGIAGKSHSGFVGGVHMGYDWQFGQFVIGGVLDLSFADLGGSFTDSTGTPYTITRDLDFLASVRLRAGLAFSDRLLGYVTGGIAYGDVKYRLTHSAPPGVFTTTGGHSSKFGYTIGGGLEARVTQHVSIGLEYLYTDLGKNDFRVSTAAAPPTVAAIGAGNNLAGFNSRFDFHTIQLRLNYRF